jgi:aminopeptidase YwaD
LRVYRAGPQTARSVLELTASLVARHPARIAGTPGSLEAGETIARLLGEHCDRVTRESFTMHPGSLWNTGRIMAVCYCLTALLLFPGGAFACASLIPCLFGLTYGVTHYFLYRNPFDRAFPAATGCNVAGVIEPAQSVERQVLIVAHHDGPYVFRFLERAQVLALTRLLGAIAAYVLATGLSLTALIQQILGPAAAPLRDWRLYAVSAGLVFAVPLFFLITGTPSPGAGDNLNASVMAVEIARIFASRKSTGDPLRHTRLVLLSTDGEEAGQRGAEAFALRHGSELSETPSFVLAIDSVYCARDLSLLLRDRNGTIGLSSGMALECHRIAAELGYRVKKAPLPLGGGGTDAAAFACAGIESTSLIGLSTAAFAKGRVYHTSRDTVEGIEPRAVEAALEIAVNYLLWKDGVWDERALKSPEASNV